MGAALTQRRAPDESLHVCTIFLMSKHVFLSTVVDVRERNGSKKKRKDKEKDRDDEVPKKKKRKSQQLEL